MKKIFFKNRFFCILPSWIDHSGHEASFLKSYQLLAYKSQNKLSLILPHRNKITLRDIECIKNIENRSTGYTTLLIKMVKNLINLKKYINCPIIDKDQVSGHHLYVINFKFNKKDLRNKAIKFLYKKGIISQVHYIPIYKFNYYKKICKGDFSGAEKYYKNSLSLPNFVSLKEKQILFICKTLSSFIKKNYD